MQLDITMSLTVFCLTEFFLRVCTGGASALPFNSLMAKLLQNSSKCIATNTFASFLPYSCFANSWVPQMTKKVSNNVNIADSKIVVLFLILIIEYLYL